MYCRETRATTHNVADAMLCMVLYVVLIWLEGCCNHYVLVIHPSTYWKARASKCSR
jgi:hypothetical protein